MRAVRSFRLVVFASALIAALSIGVASASAFSLSSSTATTQAGAPTDLSFTYVASGTQSLGRLDVDLPPGVVHDPSSTPACPVADFRADRCQTPRLGHTASVINIGGVNTSVTGDIFPIADPADNSDFPLGIVLRPPLSALGLTGKIYLRDRVNFTNGGGLRHSITGSLSSVSVLGIPLRSRISRMALTFTGRNATGNQTYNSTSCATTHFRAQATFSDGTSENRTSPYSAVGCDRLIFTGGFELRNATPGATQPKSFGAKLGSSAKAPAGVTHEYHRVGGKLDVTNFGEWDGSALVSGPACTASEVATGTCPERAQLGRVRVGIEGFPGIKTGAIYNSFPRGAKPRGAIRLGSDAVILFTVDFVTDADDRSSFVVDGLPQLPLTDIEIEIDAPVFERKGKPASCSGREARGVILGHSGGFTNTNSTVPAEPCPPSVSFADAQDVDSDGDGFADDELRAENFHVWYEVVDGGDGVDADTIRCSIEPADPARLGRGKVKSVRDMGGNLREGCEVTEAEGDVSVILSVASLSGHVTVLKSSYHVDSEPPVAHFTQEDELDFSTPEVEVEFDVTDDTLTHPQSEITAEAELSTGQTAKAKVVTDRDSGRSKGFARFSGVPDGEHELTLRVRDKVGHVTLIKRTINVDTTGPVIEVNDPRDDDSDDDGLADDELRAENFSVGFNVADASGKPGTKVSCSADFSSPESSINVNSGDTIGDGPGDCVISDATSGPLTVTISAVDWRGHVTVLKISYTVDSEAPVISGAGRGFYWTPQVEDEFDVTDDTMRHPQSEFEASCAIRSPKLEGGKEGLAKVIVDRDTGRSKGFCSIADVADGEYELTFRVRDKVGHVTLIKRTINVSTTPPSVTIFSPTIDQQISYNGTLLASFQAVGDGPFAFVCRIDSFVVSSSCNPTSSFSLVGVSSGSHDFTVEATDAHGRPASQTVRFGVAQRPPDVCSTLYPPPAGCPGAPPPICLAIYPSPQPGCPGYQEPGGGVYCDPRASFCTVYSTDPNTFP